MTNVETSFVDVLDPTLTINVENHPGTMGCELAMDSQTVDGTDMLEGSAYFLVQMV